MLCLTGGLCLFCETCIELPAKTALYLCGLSWFMCDRQGNPPSVASDLDLISERREQSVTLPRDLTCAARELFNGTSDAEAIRQAVLYGVEAKLADRQSGSD